jgi:hypothetical protein
MKFDLNNRKRKWQFLTNTDNITKEQNLTSTQNLTLKTQTSRRLDLQLLGIFIVKFKLSNSQFSILILKQIMTISTNCTRGHI